ncbi:malonic semialdehyde reductase [Saccharospirillum impatiens]|uniref:malonic semialdehyde reductase n=1 Tax=Saccharospirillum impatiens TaxID=169438 RepID=UPI0003FD73E6|nr:malonic semialdehyde reductase [Saccharospirillum impatiens]
MTTHSTAPLAEPRHTPLDSGALDQLFVGARTFSYWQDRPVDDDRLRHLAELAGLAPTSMNCNPLRVYFLRTEQAREQLVPALKEGNIEKVRQAPVTAILAYDRRFYDHLPTLFPHMKDARSLFVGNEPLREETAFRNGSIQGGYFILAARALGLDCGPISGFDNDKVDQIFFGAENQHWRSNFICNLGYGDETRLHARSPRLSFDESCRLL